ncbi:MULTISPECIES: Asd/ArgC dimerization domain-containing protein [unclassified Endozoicomonas]|uniref:Asd/ArgC dimerization domain-containing protein n=1 Tax=unclassified Endozoicomonas TaxID=2644528 RepID=UPI0021493B26|nr:MULTISPECIES: Asd/ArgC dimerization domain-containing protein [unclassified Endozoicomonas]
MSGTFNLAIYDAQSLAGEAVLTVLEESHLVPGVVYPLSGSEESTEPGDEATVTFKGTELDVLSALTFNYADADLLIIPAGSQVNPEVLNLAGEDGCRVVNGAIGAEAEIYLPGLSDAAKLKGLQEVAIPASPAALMLQVMKTLQNAVGIDSVNVMVNLSLAESGQKGIEELRGQTIDLLSGKPVRKQLFEQRIAFNVLPQVGDVTEGGFTSVERLIAEELVKGLDQDDLRVSATCVRVPVFFGDSLAVHLDLDRSVDEQTIRQLLTGIAGIELAAVDEMPSVETVAGKNVIVVGRIRQNPDHADQICLWIVADPVRCGAIQALAVAEILLKDFLK